MSEPFCYRCGDRFDQKDLTVFQSSYLCEGCLEIAKTNLQKARQDKFEQLCPKIYRETERCKLPLPEKLDAVMAWKYDPKGLLLVGPNRKGKSRCAWKLIEREMLIGASVAVCDWTAGLEYARTFKQEDPDTLEWVQHRCKVHILLLDDVFKVKLTDSFEQVVFGIIEERTSWGLPIIVTLNDTGETLRQRMSQDRADGILLRLQEFCSPIVFT